MEEVAGRKERWNRVEENGVPQLEVKKRYGKGRREECGSDEEDVAGRG